MWLYRGALELELSDPDSIVAGTEGMTASFLKELLRRAALTAAESTNGTGPLTVTDDELRSALGDLLDEGNRLTRVLLGADSSPG